MQNKETLMLENSNLIDGKDGKRVNELIKDYQDITTKLSDLETSKKKVLEELFTLVTVGKNETTQFTFSIVNNSGRKTIPVAEFVKQSPELFKKVSALGLINVGSEFKTVRGIKLKGERS